MTARRCSGCRCSLAPAQQTAELLFRQLGEMTALTDGGGRHSMTWAAYLAAAELLGVCSDCLRVLEVQLAGLALLQRAGDPPAARGPRP